MNEIRDAILADQLDAVGGLAVPESYRAVVVRKDEQDMFEGLAPRRRTRASRCTWRRWRPRSWARVRRWWR